MTVSLDFFGAKKLSIVIISPQRWVELPVSKHNYAEMLSSLGHRVYFIEPQNGAGSLKRPVLQPISSRLGNRITVVNWWLPVPYALKFHAKTVYAIAAKYSFGRIVSTLPDEPDLIWDFDNTGMFPAFPTLPDTQRLWHVVDPPLYRHYKGQRITVSTSQVYLDALDTGGRPTAVVPHGVRPVFAELARRTIDTASSGVHAREGPIKAASFGNLSHGGIDWPTLEAVCRDNSDILFDLAGPFDPAAVSLETAATVRRIKALPNVNMPGQLDADELLVLAANIDVWFLCYQTGADIVGALTSHKMLEYLATGRPVVLTGQDVETYAHLVSVAVPCDPQDFAARLREAANQARSPDASNKRRARCEFALARTYERNLELISELMQS